MGLSTRNLRVLSAAPRRKELDAKCQITVELKSTDLPTIYDRVAIRRLDNSIHALYVSERYHKSKAVRAVAAYNVKLLHHFFA